MVTHVVLIHCYLRLHRPKRLQLGLRLLKLGGQHGALELGIRTVLQLPMVCREKQHIEEHQHCRKVFQ